MLVSLVLYLCVWFYKGECPLSKKIWTKQSVQWENLFKNEVTTFLKSLFSFGMQSKQSWNRLAHPSIPLA